MPYDTFVLLFLMVNSSGISIEPLPSVESISPVGVKSIVCKAYIPSSAKAAIVDSATSGLLGFVPVLRNMRIFDHTSGCPSSFAHMSYRRLIWAFKRHSSTGSIAARRGPSPFLSIFWEFCFIGLKKKQLITLHYFRSFEILCRIFSFWLIAYFASIACFKAFLLQLSKRFFSSFFLEIIAKL